MTKDADIVFSVGFDDFTRNQVIEALACLDGLEKATLNSWTDKELSQRIWNAYESEEEVHVVNDALMGQAGER